MLDAIKIHIYWCVCACVCLYYFFSASVGLLYVIALLLLAATFCKMDEKLMASKMEAGGKERQRA